MDLITEQLNTARHDRNSFDCGVSELNTFLKQHANQNQLRNISKTYVAVIASSSAEIKKIYGYYTLSAGQLSFDHLPESEKSKIPKYPIPIARIGRLAIDKNDQGQGIGSFLLYDAFTKILNIAEKIGIFALVVDAKNEKAKAFYKNYGFNELQNSGLTLFLPVKTIKAAQ